MVSPTSHPLTLSEPAAGGDGGRAGGGKLGTSGIAAVYFGEDMKKKAGSFISFIHLRSVLTCIIMFPDP